MFSAVRALHNQELVQNLKTVNFVLKQIIYKRGCVLFVNTSRSKLQQRVTEHFARRAGQPYVVSTWAPGSLTNFLATQRHYEHRNKGGANFKHMPDLIFVSNVEQNRTLFREANSLMIPTTGIIHSNTVNNEADSRSLFVSYPLPTYAPRSLSSVYFCNKIISDIILHHRRKLAAYSLYSIAPATTAAGPGVYSPTADPVDLSKVGPDEMLLQDDKMMEKFIEDLDQVDGMVQQQAQKVRSTGILGSEFAGTK